MILEANQHNIKWLTERLYQVTRELQATGVHEPTFVLLTRGAQDRQRVEQIFWTYFRSKYAPAEDVLRHCQYQGATSKASYFQLPDVPCRIVLMDI